MIFNEPRTGYSKVGASWFISFPHAVRSQLCTYTTLFGLETFSIFRQKVEKFSPAKFKPAFSSEQDVWHCHLHNAGSIYVSVTVSQCGHDKKGCIWNCILAAASTTLPLPVSSGTVACKFHAKICEIFDFKWRRCSGPLLVPLLLHWKKIEACKFWA